MDDLSLKKEVLHKLLKHIMVLTNPNLILTKLACIL